MSIFAQPPINPSIIVSSSPSQCASLRPLAVAGFFRSTDTISSRNSNSSRPWHPSSFRPFTAGGGFSYGFGLNQLTSFSRANEGDEDVVMESCDGTSKGKKRSFSEIDPHYEAMENITSQLHHMSLLGRKAEDDFRRIWIRLELMDIDTPEAELMDIEEEEEKEEEIQDEFMDEVWVKDHQSKKRRCC